MYLLLNMAGCGKILNLNAGPVSTTDMPIDNAVLATSIVAGGEFIWGVRGPYVFKINSTTGALIIKAKVDREMFGPTCIAYNSVTDRLLIAGWNKPFPGITSDENGPNAGNTYYKLYVVNPSTLVVDSSSLLNVALNSFNGLHGSQVGPVSMKWIGSGATEGLWGIHRIDNYSELFRYVTGTVYTKKWSNVACLANIVNDLTWDGIDTVYWSNSNLEEVQSYSMSSNAGAWVNTAAFSVWTADSSIPFGVEVAPSTGDVYAGTQQGTIKRLDSALTTLISTCNTGVSGTIYKVRYNPYDGLLYCPIFTEDTIAVVDPATNTLSGVVHSGYDSPWDLVFSATKTWVIQGGNLGVKLFT